MSFVGEPCAAAWPSPLALIALHTCIILLTAGLFMFHAFVAIVVMLFELDTAWLSVSVSQLKCCRFRA